MSVTSVTQEAARGHPGHVRVLAATIFALGIGEELFQSFLPAYIVALGGTAAVAGVFGSCRDLLDGAYQIPGGWIADRWGSRRTIVLFTAVAIAGYAAYALAPSWPLVFAGLAASMAWKAGAFPATFAMIGESLQPGDRVRGFTMQSVAVRVPRVIAAPVGGLLIWTFGAIGGVRAGAAVAVALGLAALAIQRWGFAAPDVAQRRDTSWMAASTLAPGLRRLLGAECLVRIGEAIAATFVVLYVTNVLDVPLPIFGLLYALQQAVSLLLYLAAPRVAAAAGTRALIAATFAFFALFPLALVGARGVGGLVLAFVAGGFKEIGEPARKAAIVDLCRPASRAREVGMYYSIRNLVIVPGGIVGALLWEQSPSLVFVAAAAISAAGLALFVWGEAKASRRKGGVHPAVVRPFRRR